METTAQQIAKEFATRIQCELTADQIIEVNRRNATAEYQNGACATHDFCDANLPMSSSFEAVTGRGIDVSADIDAQIWNAAWRIAREAGFDQMRPKLPAPAPCRG